MIYEIPLTAIPAQLVAVVIGDHAYEIELRQIGASLYTSVTIDGVQITRNVRARGFGTIPRGADARVPVEIYWQDTQGEEPPQFEGLGSRWVLAYEVDDDGE